MIEEKEEDKMLKKICIGLAVFLVLYSAPVVFAKEKPAWVSGVGFERVLGGVGGLKLAIPWERVYPPKNSLYGSFCFGGTPLGLNLEFFIGYRQYLSKNSPEGFWAGFGVGLALISNGYEWTWNSPRAKAELYYPRYDILPDQMLGLIGKIQGGYKFFITDYVFLEAFLGFFGLAGTEDVVASGLDGGFCIGWAS